MSTQGRPGRRSPQWANVASLDDVHWVEPNLGQSLLFAPRPCAADEKTVPFGKYIEQPLSELLADRPYVDWLLTTASWLPRKYPDIYSEVVQAHAEPPPELGFEQPIYIASTRQEVDDYLDAHVWPRYQPHYRRLTLTMDDDPTKLYIYLPTGKAVVYYALHEATGVIKIGTSRDAAGRVRSLRHNQSLTGPWKLLAFEPGSYDVETRRHRQFRDHLIGFGPDGERAQELFKPAADLVIHVADVLDHCREWPSPTPRTATRARFPFHRVVLDEQLPSLELAVEDAPEALVDYMRTVAS